MAVASTTFLVLHWNLGSFTTSHNGHWGSLALTLMLPHIAFFQLLSGKYKVSPHDIPNFTSFMSPKQMPHNQCCHFAIGLRSRPTPLDYSNARFCLPSSRTLVKHFLRSVCLSRKHLFSLALRCIFFFLKL